MNCLENPILMIVLFAFQVDLCPFLRYETLEWAPLVSGRRLRRVQVQFFCLKRYAYYLPGRVCHQFTQEFSIPRLPPIDMVSEILTRAAARTALAMSAMARSRFTIRETSRDGYMDWFEWVGKPHLFPEDLREGQMQMWYNEGWSQVKNSQYRCRSNKCSTCPYILTL